MLGATAIPAKQATTVNHQATIRVNVVTTSPLRTKGGQYNPSMRSTTVVFTLNNVFFNFNYIYEDSSFTSFSSMWLQTRPTSSVNTMPRKQLMVKNCQTPRYVNQTKHSCFTCIKCLIYYIKTHIFFISVWFSIQTTNRKHGFPLVQRKRCVQGSRFYRWWVTWQRFWKWQRGKLFIMSYINEKLPITILWQGFLWVFV